MMKLLVFVPVALVAPMSNKTIVFGTPDSNKTELQKYINEKLEAGYNVIRTWRSEGIFYVMFDKDEDDEQTTKEEIAQEARRIYSVVLQVI